MDIWVYSPLTNAVIEPSFDVSTLDLPISQVWICKFGSLVWQDISEEGWMWVAHLPIKFLFEPYEVTLLGIFLWMRGLFIHSGRGWYRSIPQGLYLSDQSICLLYSFPFSCRAGNQLCVSYCLGLNPGSLGIEMHIVSSATSTRKNKRKERSSPQWLPHMKCMLRNCWFILPGHWGKLGKIKKFQGPH